MKSNGMDRPERQVDEDDPGADVVAILFFLAMAIWGVYILSFEAVEIYRIGNWQLVDGTIEYVSKEAKGGGEAAYTCFEFTYSYSVGPKTYSGVHSKMFLLLPTPNYERGTPIRVYYDQTNPDDSIVDIGTWYHYGEVVKGLFFLGFGLSLLGVGSTGDRKKNSAKSNSAPRVR